MITSRRLSPAERQVGSATLLSNMLRGSENTLRSNGHEIIEMGKSDAFGPETPGYVIVSGGNREEFATLSFAGVTRNRNISVIVQSSSSDDREAISNITRDFVENIQVY